MRITDLIETKDHEKCCCNSKTIYSFHYLSGKKSGQRSVLGRRIVVQALYHTLFRTILLALKLTSFGDTMQKLFCQIPTLTGRNFIEETSPLLLSWFRFRNFFCLDVGKYALISEGTSSDHLTSSTQIFEILYTSSILKNPVISVLANRHSHSVGQLLSCLIAKTSSDPRPATSILLNNLIQAQFRKMGS